MQGIGRNVRRQPFAKLGAVQTLVLSVLRDTASSLQLHPHAVLGHLSSLFHYTHRATALQPLQSSLVTALLLSKLLHRQVRLSGVVS